MAYGSFPEIPYDENDRGVLETSLIIMGCMRVIADKNNITTKEALDKFIELFPQENE